MDRLTTDKPVSEMTMTELAYNGCYAKDGKARYRDYEKDIDAREFARDLVRTYEAYNLSSDDDVFDDEILEELQFDPMLHSSGLIALFYRNLWAMADLRERLKEYEDTNLTPEQMLEIDKDYRELCEKIAEYQKIEKMDGLMAAEMVPDCENPVAFAHGWNALREKIVVD